MMTGLLIFVLSALLLIGGYMLYGRLAEKVYGFDCNMTMPCEKLADGVDYVSMPTWRVFMIQLLNIAGLGPVFGALAGCLFGPVCLLWIVLGCILAGAVHDLMAAMASAERGGENLSEFIGSQLGKVALYVLR
ncbi:MAG: carbon starvation protein A, partial [Akkermansia sp.]|nr:carbon starvation protein A [Akkermansia sp.]